MFLFKCVWFVALAVALIGAGYIIAPIDWLRKWDRRQVERIERRLGRRAIPIYFRALGVVMLLAGGFVAVGLMNIAR